MESYDGSDAIERAWRDGLKPDPLLTVSEWADRYRVLSQRASSEPGRWRTERTPYLREIMDCLSPSSPYQRVVFMKGAQVGATEGGNCWIGYVIHQAPGPMMAVAPTVELAKRNSKQRIDPLIEESDVLRELVKERRSRDSGNTVLSEDFPGGVLILTGAMLHDPSGLVMGTAADMRIMAEALDRMRAGMVAAYRDKSGRDDDEIEALMAAETWLSAEEAVALGLADRVEEPVRMAARFDLSRFRNPPPQLAALATTMIPKEDDMPDPEDTRTPLSEPAAEPVQPEVPEPDPEAPAADPPVAEPQPTAQVVDLDAVRADERRATLAYVSEVHEVCALAGRGDLAAGFMAKAAPVADVRRALLDARAAEDEATAIRGHVRTPNVEPVQPAIDTAAIYAARNQNVR